MRSFQAWRGIALAAMITLYATPSYGQLEGVLGAASRPAIKITDQIYQASGFGNTFMVLTDAGNVIIDTSLLNLAQQHHKVLREISQAPTRYIIFTHAHEDHTSGACLWKEAETQVIAQKLFTDTQKYQDRLAGFFTRRNAAQFGFDEQRLMEVIRSRPPRVEPTILFDEHYEFELGRTRFELFHTPGETYEHLTVWLPQSKAAFVGDNFYASFPNMYTLRGTRPRWALDYIDSLNKVLALRPEILLPSHGDVDPRGRESDGRADALPRCHPIRTRRDGQRHERRQGCVHDHARGQAARGTRRRRCLWQGLVERARHLRGYVGWFDGDPANMYVESPRDADIELVRLAGGAGPVAKRAGELVDAGQHVQGLRLAGIALAAEPGNEAATKARVAALKALLAKSRNSNERGWLGYGLRQLEKTPDAATGGR